MCRDETDNLDQVERKIGYEFSNRALLDHALTHKSFLNENPEAIEDNQRLEFLGDAVLGLVVAEALMEALPAAPEGELTQKRASLVNEGSLAEMARQIDLGSTLKLGRGEEATDGRDRSSNLADAVEAVVGAVYLDDGYQAAKQVLIHWLDERLAEASDRGDREDVKGALQRAQGKLYKLSYPAHVFGHGGTKTRGMRSMPFGTGSSPDRDIHGIQAW